MSRGTGKFFKFRISDEEQARLLAEAEERGITRADRIREALGWDRASAPVLPTSQRTKDAIVKPPPGPPADPDKEPGKAAIEELAKRIHGSEGVPMRVASQRAKERLTD